MGTFHHGKHELHGITVVVDTHGPKVFVGRCEDMDDRKVMLVDVDEHSEGQGGKSKREYLERAAKFGVWKKHSHLAIPLPEVARIWRLGEAAPPATVAATPVAPPPAAPAPAAAGSAPAGAARLVSLTPAAQEEIRRLLAEMAKPGYGLRLAVSGGGCSGLVYKLDFDRQKEGDVVDSYGDFEVHLDKKSAIYLRGITLDHQKGLSGKGFVFHNPNATNTCGCGESFSV